MKIRRSVLLAAAAGLALSATANAQFQIVNSEPGTYLDISSTGTSVGTVTDDSIHLFTSTVGNAIFPAGTVSVSSNGFMCAGTSTTGHYANVAIPVSGLGTTGFSTGTQGYLLPFWDDLYPVTATAGQTIYWQEIGGVLIVQWHNQGHITGVAGQTIDVEVKVFGTPVNGVYAQFLYQDTVFGGTQTAYDHAMDATIGILNDANPSFTNIQYSLNTASVNDGDVLSVKALSTATGACCKPNGTCEEITQFACTGAGGVYHGDGSACAGANCPQPGGCCLVDGSCTVVQSAACAAQGGTYGGNGTTCATACPNAPVCSEVTGLAIPIADATAGGVPGPESDCPLTVNSSGVINGMSVHLRITHTFQGDLRVRLVHPDGTSADLIARPGVTAPKFSNTTEVGFASDGYGGPGATDWMVFDDTAPNGVYDDAVGFPGPPPGSVVTGGVANPTGRWQPETGDATISSLGSAFNGKNMQGVWHLMVSDHWPIDTGTINGFGLCFAQASVATCYANCDGSSQQPCLNVLDFGCFLNHFAAGDTYANCDNSTQSPVLNVLDFGCFLNKFAAGCSSC